MIAWLPAAATIGVVATALYLLALGGAALLHPSLASRFLGGFVSSAFTHFAEVGLRVLAGAALVGAAPRMAAAPVVAGVGWVLIGTSAVLAVLPWRWHQRFAAWSVPRATRQLPAIGVASLAAGGALLAALWLSRAVG